MTDSEDSSSEETQDPKVSDTFFRHYEDRFENDFRRAFRDVTKREDDEQGISQ